MKNMSKEIRNEARRITNEGAWCDCGVKLPATSSPFTRTKYHEMQHRGVVVGCLSVQCPVCEECAIIVKGTNMGAEILHFEVICKTQEE